MTSSNRQARFFGTGGRRVTLALVLASLIGGLSLTPAFADRNEERDRHGDQGRPQGQREWRGDHDGDGRYYYQPQYRRPYIYAQPVYVPPPVYDQPRQSPGIMLFFPLDLRR